MHFARGVLPFTVGSGPRVHVAERDTLGADMGLYTETGSLFCCQG